MSAPPSWTRVLTTSRGAQALTATARPKPPAIKGAKTPEQSGRAQAEQRASASALAASGLGPLELLLLQSVLSHVALL